MATKVYGASDDLIEFDGEIHGEVGCFGTDDADVGVLVVFSDGTLLEAKFGKGGHGIWEIRLIKRGTLLREIVQCDSEYADPHSDVAHFADGLEWAYAAKGSWERVK